MHHPWPQVVKSRDTLYDAYATSFENAWRGAGITGGVDRVYDAADAAVLGATC